jgi:hypothetical protein
VAWQTLWSTCCANRVTGQVDPLSTGRTRDYDFYGSVTQTQTLNGTQTFARTNTTYDQRHRPIQQDVAVTMDESGSVTKKLSTRWLYDENLADGQGLDNTAGVAVTSAKNPANSYGVSIAQLLEKVNTALVAQGQTVVFGPGSGGSAVAVINPEDEISVSISDAAGRTVASGIIAQNGTPITWNLVKYDEVDQATGLVKTSRIDALGHTVSQLADAASRRAFAIAFRDTICFNARTRSAVVQRTARSPSSESTLIAASLLCGT